MKTLDGTQIELIDAILAERGVGGLTPAIFGKDIHATDALLVLLRQHFVGATVVFYGGTSLSKAYGKLSPSKAEHCQCIAGATCIAIPEMFQRRVSLPCTAYFTEKLGVVPGNSRNGVSSEEGNTFG